MGMSVTWKPVPNTIVSTSRSLPSAVTIECGRTSRIPSVTTSTFGCVSAGYHSLLGRMRLQPIAKFGFSLRRSSGSFTWEWRWRSATRSTRFPNARMAEEHHERLAAPVDGRAHRPLRRGNPPEQAPLALAQAARRGGA